MNLFFLSDTIIQWDPVFFCAMLRYCVIFSKIIQDQDPIMIQHYQGINMESSFWIRVSTCATTLNHLPIGSMYAIYGNVYHQYTPNVSMDPMGYVSLKGFSGRLSVCLAALTQR